MHFSGSSVAGAASPRPSLKHLVILLLLAAAAFAVHGYHPYVEDGEIYVPGIEKALNPALFPRNDAFFASHARMTLFPNLIAASVRLSHLPFDWALMAWQFFAVFLLLLACWHIGWLCFHESRAVWGGVALVASLLTIPVAGTALYIMDQYLNTRSLSTPAVLFILVNVLERKYWRAGLWSLFTILIHPLMVVFGLSFALLVLWMDSAVFRQKMAAFTALAVFPFGMFPPATAVYRQVLQTRPYFFILRWAWYEWVGIFAPLLLLWWFHRIAQERNLQLLSLLCRALIVFQSVYFVMALVLTIPPSLANFAELQPMRSLHLLYVLLFVFIGGLIAQFILKRRIWLWLLFFAPICAGMSYAQFSLFPSSPHIEWPNSQPGNSWVQAFLWTRDNTPLDAYFALDPDHMLLPGEDQHGFRAIAERSMLADRAKDSGAVTMFPQLADAWLQQVRAQEGWKTFRMEDFERLKREFGVTWVVLEQAPPAGMTCPYRNSAVSVCRID